MHLFQGAHNNSAERALRVVAPGRKTSLSVGSDASGELAQSSYSLIGFAKLNGIESEAYLRDVLTNIPDQPIIRIYKLLPSNMRVTELPQLTQSVKTASK